MLSVQEQYNFELFKNNSTVLKNLSNFTCIKTVVVMGATLGTPPFKPEKNLVFFFRIKIRRTHR